MSTLDDRIRAAIREDGLEELTLRVSRYSDLSEGMGEPAAWQAIAKYRGKSKGPWGVGIRGNAIAAVEAALKAGASLGDAEPANSLDIEDIFG